MRQINGIDFTDEYLPDFKWVSDIQYFEGSLLSEYQTSKGDTYVFLWCDCSSSLNRWLAARTNKRSLYMLTAGLVSMRDFFENRLLDKNVFILDTDNEDVIHQARLIHLSVVADDYLPESGAYVSRQLMPRELLNNGYPILIDGNWETSELTDMPKMFMDVYALISRFKSTASQIAGHITSAPWKGGFSSAHFYFGLKKDFCQGVGIKAIQYASPGYIEFSANRETSLLVKDSLDTYIVNKKAINKAFTESSVYLRDQGLNDEDAIPNATDLDFLDQSGTRLMVYFSNPTWSWIKNNCPDNFVAIKVARSYVTRLRALEDYVRSGKVEFAKQ